MTILTIIVAVVIVTVLMRWIARRLRFGLALIIAIVVGVVVWFFVGAVLILGPGDVCNPGITWLLTLITIIIVIIVIFRSWFVSPPPPPPPPTPPGANVTGNAQLTTANGNQMQLTNSNLGNVGPGTTVETGNSSFVRVPTPQGSNSQSVIGQDSSVSWLDLNFKTPIPWLRFPGVTQIYNLGSLLLRLDFGKLLLNWMESAASQEAVIILPAGLIGAAASAAMSRWLARVKGTMVLVEAAQDGTAAAITVLEGKESSVELWRSDDLNRVIEIHPGERVILKTDLPYAKMRVDVAKGLAQQLQDPFGLLHKLWTIPPMSDETNAALATPVQASSGTTTSEKISACPNCGMKIPSDLKFCTHCGKKLEPAEKQEQNRALEPSSKEGKVPCTSCGRDISPNLKFCTYCGRQQQLLT
jgi:hypothetical protein